MGEWMEGWVPIKALTSRMSPKSHASLLFTSILASKAAITCCQKKAGNSNVQNDLEWHKNAGNSNVPKCFKTA